MRTFIKVSVLLSEKVVPLQDRIESLCGTIVRDADYICYFPAAGNLFFLLQLLQSNGIQYEIGTTPED